MAGFKRGIGPAVAVLAFALAAPAGAQENLDQGKSGAQLFAADCAICHKTPQSVPKSGGVLGLSSFLREHYTASRESADMIATYLQSFGNAPASSRSAGKRKAKADEKKSKPGEAKSEKPDKPGKPAESKATGAKAEPKSEPKSDTKSDTKSEPKSDKSDKSEPKTEPKSEPKTSEPKSGDAKPSADKPAEAKPGEPKPDKPQKPD